jgi:hypothetical protein
MNSINASTACPLQALEPAPSCDRSCRGRRGIQPAREFRSNKRKKMKEKYLSFPFICFHKFFGIGTFHSLQAIQRKKIFPFFARVLGCVRGLKQKRIISPFRASAERRSNSVPEVIA